MAHYFTDNSNLKSNETTFKCKVFSAEYTFFTDDGVFSKSHLDFGSLLLIEEFKNPETKGLLLDLGCGIGVIGITLSKEYQRDVDFIDVNPRALDLAKKNADSYNINYNAYLTSGFEGIDKTYAVVVTNPPIRAGKKVIYSFFHDAYNHLEIGGELWFVMRRNHGVESAIKEIDSIYGNHEVIKRKNGFWIVKTIKLK